LDKFNTDAVYHLLRQCPAYAPTPLRSLDVPGRGPCLIKDETDRMKLGAFKALGGVYAVAKLLAEQITPTAGTADYTSEEFRRAAAEITFVCASAGNHGMAVAAGAAIFGAQSRVHLAASVPEDFAARLRQKGATVVWSGDTYEQSIQMAMADADARGAIHLADGSWPGYTHAPGLVMEGYTVLADEMRQEFEINGHWPTVVYLQAGVGGLAAAVSQAIRDTWSVQPRLVVVEPDAALCLAASVAAGEMLTVEGPLSNMGRLDCKTPSLLAFEILRQHADDFVTVSDQQALDAAERLAKLGIGTTPSGAAGYAAWLADPASTSRPLVIISEGRTDG
jgi:diaminopropionate ammonia-lyase